MVKLIMVKLIPLRRVPFWLSGEKHKRGEMTFVVSMPNREKTELLFNIFES